MLMSTLINQLQSIHWRHLMNDLGSE